MKPLEALRRLFRPPQDDVIEGLIAHRGVKADGKRRRWTDFDPQLRERTKIKQEHEARLRRNANRIASCPPLPAAIEHFERRQRG